MAPQYRLLCAEFHTHQMQAVSDARQHANARLAPPATVLLLSAAGGPAQSHRHLARSLCLQVLAERDCCQTAARHCGLHHRCERSVHVAPLRQRQPCCVYFSSPCCGSSSKHAVVTLASCSVSRLHHKPHPSHCHAPLGLGHTLRYRAHLSPWPVETRSCAIVNW